MALDLKAIREALANQINQNVERSANVQPYMPTSTGGYPIIGIDSGSEYLVYHGTFGSPTVGPQCDVQLEIVIKHNARSIDAQMVLDEYLSSGTGMGSSIIDAIETDRTLGGVVDTCIARVASGLLPQDDGTFEARIPLEVTLRRT